MIKEEITGGDGQMVYTGLSSLVWRPDFALGNEVIDRQHRGFFGQIGIIDGLLAGGAPDMQVLSAIGGIAASARRHFLTEERLLDRCSFPGAVEHRLEHYVVSRQLDDMVDEVAATPSAAHRGEIARRMVVMLLEHMVLEDRKAGPYLAAMPA